MVVNLVVITISIIGGGMAMTYKNISSLQRTVQKKQVVIKSTKNIVVGMRQAYSLIIQI